MDKNKTININIYGIKCDTPGCGYVDKEVKFEDYKKYINKPCPICGGNLLKRRDYIMCKALVFTANLINKIVIPTETENQTYVRYIDCYGKREVKTFNSLDELEKDISNEKGE